MTAEEQAKITVKGWSYEKRIDKAVRYVNKYFNYAHINATSGDKWDKLIQDASIIFFVRKDYLLKHF